jgi:cell division protein FtsL
VFLVFAALIVTALVGGAASLSAMLVQASFRVDELEATVGELTDHGEVLVTEIAELSSPSRIARWAEDRGMVMPDDVVALRVPAGAPV